MTRTEPLNHWAGALLRASQATTRQQARDLINVAVLRGASLHDASRALALWDRDHPTEARSCLCSHHETHHENGGECWFVACGCRTHRPAVTA